MIINCKDVVVGGRDLFQDLRDWGRPPVKIPGNPIEVLSASRIQVWGLRVTRPC